MTEILNAMGQAEGIVLYKDGQPFEFGKDTKEFAMLEQAWAEMARGALQMSAFGVSIDAHTREERKSGLWAEFLFGEKFSKEEMPFERLLVRCVETYSGFNLVRYWEGEYTGRCFYLNLQDRTMKTFCSCAKMLTEKEH